MPAASAKQKKFMDAAAHNPAFAKKAGVPVKVAKEFSKASKGQTFKGDGEMKESKAMVKKEVSFMKAKGAPKSMVKHEMKEAGMKKMANGGITKAKMGKVPSGGTQGKGEHAIQSKGISKGTMVRMSGSKPLGMKMGGKAC
jgi:hypothetical protein